MRSCALHLIPRCAECNRDPLPIISFRSAQLETVQALVSAGVEISLVPAMAARSDQEGLSIYRSLTAPRPRRQITVFWPRARQMRRAVDAFLNPLVKLVATRK
ncbi:MAG: hypothetical protein EB141_04315 [Verrucomicrobia bacterium]|nr:hypothetical protein [Verrucomicrobiota bacterium]NBU07782.1 hypothetical protein [Pseudomonadota bacterium]NDA66176.1 hypothetical protein [Verrucomicrobiota bacterium]NDB74860.1 hypothetical protein [Verrucomicrobiota bacterium]NDD37997.1 hypothetical protein [Verrucomicrobiota bacterium]